MRAIRNPFGILRWVAVFVVCSAIFVNATVAAQSKPEEFTMVLGEELAFQGMQEFAIENQQVLSAAISRDGKGVVVKALRPGVSRVLFRLDSAGQRTRIVEIVVGDRDPRFVVSELEVLLRPYPDLKLKTNRMTVIVEGLVKNEQDLRSVRDILRRYEGQVTELITLPTLLPQRNIMIRLDLHFVSVRRRFSHKIGIGYPAGVTGAQIHALTVEGLTLGSGFFAQSSVLPNLLPSLDFSEANGYIRIKRIDTLITENGTKATYKEGSELPIRLTAAIGSGSLEKMFFGSELNVTPRLNPGGDSIALEIHADISQKDNAVTQDGIPGRTLSQLRSNVQIPLGQSVMLSGVDFQSGGHSLTGLPGLSRIPILGYLFRTESRDAESAYSVVYITPTLIEKSSDMSIQQLEKALQNFDKPTSLPIQRY